VLDFARPALLGAGLLAALVPLALHLISRRPPERAVLPTARFLSPDARTAVRVRRRPTDLLLLALRVLLLVLLGAAAAGPAWLPVRGGTAEVVLLDRSAAMDGPAWEAAVGEARRTLLAPDGSVRGALVLFDSAAAPARRSGLTPALFDSLVRAGPGGGAADYAAALREIPAAARELGGADSVRVTLLSPLVWDGWRPGLPAVRRAAWAGPIRLPDLPEPGNAPVADAPQSPSGSVVVVSPPGVGRYVSAALGATGWSPRAPDDGEPADAYFLLDPAAVPAPVEARVRAALEAGATVVLSGEAPPLRDLLPWEAGGDAGPGGALLLDDGTRLEGPAVRVPGRPAPGSQVLAAWEDGGAAAAAARSGRGCVVYLAADPEAGRLPLSAAYPRALARLARGCDAPGPVPAGGVPLDAGARAVLRGEGSASGAVAAPRDAAGGVPLGRWALAAALLVALAETALAYGGRRTP